MQYRELAVPGAWEATPTQFGDDRGVFLEWFREPGFTEATGFSFDLRQANCSVSSAGSLRGIHYADVPPGQAKYVTCVSGAVFDVVVDLRVGSPAFGRWDCVLLDDTDRRAVFLPHGVGHGFLSLTEGSTVVYLCDAEYDPTGEHGIDPFDEELDIEWPTVGRDGGPLAYILSDKDRAAPSLAATIGRLPRWG